MDNTTSFLEHHGILGMRWGVRRSRQTLDRMAGRNRKAKPESSADSKKKTFLKKKALNSLSNSELKTLNERLNLERQYRDLTKQDMSSGKKFISSVLSSAAKQTATNFVSQAMSAGTNQLLKKIKNGS